MRECFQVRQRRSVDQDATIGLLNFFASQYVTGPRAIPINLRHMVTIAKARKLQINRLEGHQAAMATWLREAWLRGALDWDVTPLTQPPLIYAAPQSADRPILLVATTDSLTYWLTQWAKVNACTTVQLVHSWRPNVIYAMLPTWEKILRDTGRLRFRLVTSRQREASAQISASAFVKQTARMIAVRQARDQLNKEEGINVWQPTGLHLPPTAGNQYIARVRNRAGKFAKMIAADVRSRIEMVYTAPVGDDAGRPLLGLDPLRLDGLLRAAVAVNSDALDNQVSRAGFKHVAIRT